jgi:hypothetical protein
MPIGDGKVLLLLKSQTAMSHRKAGTGSVRTFQKAAPSYDVKEFATLHRPLSSYKIHSAIGLLPLKSPSFFSRPLLIELRIVSRHEWQHSHLFVYNLFLNSTNYDRELLCLISDQIWLSSSSHKRLFQVNRLRGGIEASTNQIPSFSISPSIAEKDFLGSIFEIELYFGSYFPINFRNMMDQKVTAAVAGSLMDSLMALAAEVIAKWSSESPKRDRRSWRRPAE